MSEKEKTALSGAICKFLKELIQQADEFQIDRDSYVRAAADMFQLMTEISTFEHFNVTDRETGAKVDTHTREGFSHAGT